MKSKRQEKLLSLINESIVVTQDELQDALLKAGFNVTQSTVSRDIKELRIVKAQDINGIYRYISPRAGQIQIQEKSKDHFVDMFSKSAVSVDFALNNIVIKCYNGMASSACVAFDALFGDMILGSLAGDDTIIVVTRNEHDSLALTEKLRKFI